MEIGIPILCTILGVVISVATFYKGRKKDVARLMLSAGEPISKITLFTGLTEKEIKGLLS